MSPDDPPFGRGELSHLLEGAEAEASTARLASIVARSRRRRDRRLKIATGVSIVVALAGAGVAGITQANRPSAGNTTVASGAARIASGPSSPAWTNRHQSTGMPPKGLKWSLPTANGATGAKSATPSTSKSSFRAADLCTTAGCGIGYPYGFSGTLTKLFVRSVGDVTMRAFEETAPQVVPEPSVQGGSAPSASTSTSNPGTTSSAGTSVTPIYYPVCEATHAISVEVSNPGSIGEITVPQPPQSAVSDLGQPFEVIDSSVVGVAEGSPIEVITVRVNSNVNSVKATFSDGATDQMNVVDGWAVLVDDGNSPIPATVTALDASSNEVGSVNVTDDNAIAEPELCFVPLTNPGGLASGAAQSSPKAK